ncbi:hypothetical protein NCPPB3778_30 [Rathayibacter phage NCPPB3778]|nr:hypothetical protein NCPPB3778_30 [Rathayibacter phage NCPPB3778]
MPEHVIWVTGSPAPKGSHVRTKYGVRDASKRVKPWQEAIRVATSAYIDEAAFFDAIDAPVKVILDFYIRKPRTTKATHPVAIQIGDLDKLVRSTLDGLVNGGLLADDKFVTHLVARKMFDPTRSGVAVRVSIDDVD